MAMDRKLTLPDVSFESSKRQVVHIDAYYVFGTNVIKLDWAPGVQMPVILCKGVTTLSELVVCVNKDYKDNDEACIGICISRSDQTKTVAECYSSLNGAASMTSIGKDFLVVKALTSASRGMFDGFDGYMQLVSAVQQQDSGSVQEKLSKAGRSSVCRAMIFVNQNKSYF
eukprot:TRINITY_DN12646_c4_g15_i1.p1 TRINITY_DN12646_c4_g15~~TRINITY_DN12646_c4_g15_i1.p1  ORF type:complete len:170 (+),score=14.95 TRINITY_DN12646_c4_g15_i1:2-511(+)